MTTVSTLKSIAILALVALPLGARAADVPSTGAKLLAVLKLPSDQADKSGIGGMLNDGTPANRLGGIGSAIAPLGNNRYVLLPDRGPRDGATNYRCRMHVAEILLHPAPDARLELRLISTTLLEDQQRRPLVGLASALGRNPQSPSRFDPEGVAVTSRGTVLISDEYGPSIYEFERSGLQARELPVPASFRVAHEIAEDDRELAANTSGRVPNRGFEGLTTTPDGTTIYAALQSPLIQDGGKRGRNVRILSIESGSLATRQFVYPLETPNCGISELLALGNNLLLVLERDAKSGRAARYKRIYKADLTRADDATQLASLEGATLRPVAKSLVVDLLDPSLGLAGADMPAKLEGLAWGPMQADGRRMLLVTSDNDFLPDQPTWLYALTVPARAFGR